MDDLSRAELTAILAWVEADMEVYRIARSEFA